jgi:DNA-binding NarL/FixJ family response regulator
MLQKENEPSVCGQITILIAEDHPYVRKLLCQLIGTYADLSVVGEAVNGEEAVLLTVELKPAVVVMDVHLPVVNGIAATTLIKTANPFTAIIGLTAGGPYEDEKAMIIAGAATVINKSDMLQALHPAIFDAVEQVRNPV